LGRVNVEKSKIERSLKLELAQGILSLWYFFYFFFLGLPDLRTCGMQVPDAAGTVLIGPCEDKVRTQMELFRAGQFRARLQREKYIRYMRQTAGQRAPPRQVGSRASSDVTAPESSGVRRVCI
jgi:hypothetical protein